MMLSNNTGFDMGFIAGTHQSRIGWLFSPAGWRMPKRGLPYALDNGAFSRWDEAAFLDLIQNCAAQIAVREIQNRPNWVVVPDVVADRSATLDRWHEWAPRLRPYGWPLAFAVQDGMKQQDVPADAEVIFVGGSTAWKWATFRDWAKHNARVHVGRVNGYRDLWYCDQAGVESCDGTGWFRGDKVQLAGLEQYLEESSSGGLPQTALFARE